MVEILLIKIKIVKRREEKRWDLFEARRESDFGNSRDVGRGRGANHLSGDFSPTLTDATACHHVLAVRPLFLAPLHPLYYLSKKLCYHARPHSFCFLLYFLLHFLLLQTQKPLSLSLSLSLSKRHRSNPTNIPHPDTDIPKRTQLKLERTHARSWQMEYDSDFSPLILRGKKRENFGLPKWEMGSREANQRINIYIYIYIYIEQWYVHHIFRTNFKW